jgi:hypothetical protein
VAVDSALGIVAVTGRTGGVLQLIDSRATDGLEKSSRALLRRPARDAG